MCSVSIPVLRACITSNRSQNEYDIGQRDVQTHGMQKVLLKAVAHTGEQRCCKGTMRALWECEGVWREEKETRKEETKEKQRGKGKG